MLWRPERLDAGQDEEFIPPSKHRKKENEQRIQYPFPWLCISFEGITLNCGAAAAPKQHLTTNK